MVYGSLLRGKAVRLLVLMLILGVAVGGVVDKVAAVVNNEVVTLSDLEWLISYQNLKVPDDPEGRRDLYRNVLQQLVDQKLIAAEALRTPGIQITPGQVQDRVEGFRNQFQSEEEFRKRLDEMKMTLEDLKELYRRQLSVLAFVKIRFEPFIIIVPDQIEEYYQLELVPEFGESQQELPPLDLVEEQIRQILTVERTNQEMENWVRNERRKADVEILLFREPPLAPNLPKTLRKTPEFQPLDEGS